MKISKVILLTIIYCVIFILFSVYYLHKKEQDSTNMESKIENKKDSNKDSIKSREQKDKETLESIIKKYKDEKPKVWAENPNGAINFIPDSNNKQKTLYLTLDACEGEYDSKIIDFLIQKNVRATLFINARWINQNKDTFLKLANNPLFSIQNHGTNHRPLSVNGKSIYGIKGTSSIKEVFDEINENDKLITNLTNKKPKYFRSGTAYYDDVAIKIANDMGYKIAGFSVVGDGGATFSYNKILKRGQNVKSGDILIYHFNKPKSASFKGLETLIDKWQNDGFNFGVLE